MLRWTGAGETQSNNNGKKKKGISSSELNVSGGFLSTIDTKNKQTKKKNISTTEGGPVSELKMIHLEGGTKPNTGS